jgi:hypothetical protein
MAEPGTETTEYEPTAEEIQQALERLRKQKAYRQQYQEKRAEKLETDPAAKAAFDEKRKKYFEEHKDEIYAKRKSYYDNNKDKIKQYHKTYHEKQKATMNALRAKAKEAGMNLEEYLESLT